MMLPPLPPPNFLVDLMRMMPSLLPPNGLPGLSIVK
jgi:hypothetical protein